MSKINISELIDLLAQQLSMSKTDASEFFKAFITTIEDALMQQDHVRVNGLGTFRLRWNKARKSVSVNTGEEIIIEGYHRVVFIPEAQLKELANEPYAHLETVELDPLVSDEESDDKLVEKPMLVDQEENETEEYMGDEAEDIFEEELVDEDIELEEKPLKLLDEQASEIKDILSEINALHKSEQQKETEKTPQAIVPPIPKPLLEPERPPMPTPAPALTPTPTPTPSPVVVESQTVVTDRDLPTETPVQSEQQFTHVEGNKYRIKVKLKGDRSQTKEPTEEVEIAPKEKNKTTYLVLIIALAFALLLSLAFHFKFFSAVSQFIDFYRNQQQSPEPNTQIITEIPAEAFDEHTALVTHDTEEISNPTSTELKTTPEAAPIQEPHREVAPAPVRPLAEKPADIYNQARVYNEFIATEKVVQGSRLTRIAERHYGAIEFWVYIYEANRDVLPTPAKIEPGIELKIPKLPAELVDKNNPKSIEYALKLQDKYLNQ